MKKEEVYNIIDSEIEYQEKRKFNDKLVCDSDPDKGVAEWIVYMEHYISLAKKQIFDLNNSGALENVRKITALGVSCMMNNNTLGRS